MVWGVAEVLNLFQAEDASGKLMKASITGAFLGVFIAGIIGLLDSILNSVGFARIARTAVCLGIGFVGGTVGGFVGQLLSNMFTTTGSSSIVTQGVVKTIGWAVLGVAVGASIGVFDILRAVSTQAPLRQSIRKLVNGIIGGVMGGVLGGAALYGLGVGFSVIFGGETADAMHSPRAIGLVILGMCIGLLIGTAQVFLKEAWVKVEAGFRPGREMMLSKPETTVGRAEGVDIAMFGDKDCEKLHAKIVLKSGRYYLVDNGTPGGTFLNGERISGPAPLKSGDLIQCGRSALRFGERAKRS
jgi:hypothetical protein